MGRVGVISSSAAFLAGYNLRLLTVVQAMSQLDSVYGEKEARTFATNHGLQILYAPREQRDAEEYSAMLGHFTERATSRGRSRSFGSTGTTRVEPQRERPAPRAAPAAGVQGTRRRAPGGHRRELQADPRARRSATTATRSSGRACVAPPAVPRMDMDLHFAKVQQRWRYVENELAPGDDISVEALAHDFTPLPDGFERRPPADVAETLLDFFVDGRLPGASDAGGSIEAAADDAEAPEAEEAEGLSKKTPP